MRLSTVSQLNDMHPENPLHYGKDYLYSLYGMHEELSMALTETQRAFLDEMHFAVVATISPDGSPQLTTVWYLRDGDDLLFNTAVGRVKERNLRRDPRLAVTVLAADGYRFITIKGIVTLDEASGQEVIRRLATRYHGAARAEQQMREMFSMQQRVTIRLPIANVYDHED
jgi:PPOX class probable F420-dependent enzyme